MLLENFEFFKNISFITQKEEHQTLKVGQKI